MAWTEELQETFKALREECEAWMWSRGVEIARGGGVRLARECPAEVSLLVDARDGKSVSRVDVFPADAEWSCDCGARTAACSHAAAALIALKQSSESGVALPGVGSSGAKGEVRYRFFVSGDSVALRRVVGIAEREEPLVARLGGERAPRDVIVTREDLDVERALGDRAPLNGIVPRESWIALCQALAGSELVTFEGAPARVSASPCGVRLVIVDEGPGVLMRLERDTPGATVYANGAAWVNGLLRPFVAPRMTGPMAAVLDPATSSRVVYPRDFEELVSRVLPLFDGVIPVEVRTSRLPRRAMARPRLLVETSLDLGGEGLRVVTSIVYGDPVVARLVDGRLVAVGSSIPGRDESEEARLRDVLWRDLGMELGRPMSFAGDQAVRFAERLGRWRDRVGSSATVMGEAASAFASRAPLRPVLTIGASGVFAARFVTNGGSDSPLVEAECSRVFAAWRAGERCASLERGGVAPLPRDWLDRFGDRLRELLATRDDSGRVPKALWGDAAAFAEDAGVPVPEPMAALRRLLESDLDSEQGDDVLLPVDLRADLRPYQREGTRWLARRRDQELGALLADDMGLGKTLQTIATLRGKSLVVAPTSLLFNWREEIARFRPSLRVHTFHGAQRVWDATADVTLTSYALLRMEFARLSSRVWDTLVLDEAQQIRNPDSQAARAACQIKARWRVALTGTPVENRLEDLWSLFRFLSPGLLGERSVFQDVFARQIAGGDASAAERLRRRTRPFVLRRLKGQVARDLPSRTDMTIHVDLSSEERDFYDALWAVTRREALEALDSDRGVIQALELLLRMRQAASHPGLLPDASGGGAWRRAGGSSKTRVLMEMLRTTVDEGHRALVYSQWTSMLDLVEPELREAGIAFTRLDGSTVDRQGVVARFQSDEGPPVILLSLKAGGVGLNLTRADHVYLLDPWWNPAVEEQAVGRAHRIGQSRPVMLWRLVAQDTVETRILSLQDRKRELIGAALGDDVSRPDGPESVRGLSRDDLRDLLAP